MTLKLKGQGHQAD